MIEISVTRDNKLVKEIEIGDKHKEVVIAITAITGVITLALLVGLFAYHLNYDLKKINSMDCWDLIEDSNKGLEVVEKNKTIKVFNKVRR